MNKKELYIKAVSLLKQLIAVSSFSGEEDEAASLIYTLLSENKCQPRRKGNNVWCFSGNNNPDKPVILLNSHLDTVKPTVAWTIDPYTPLEKDGKLYGLGSNDAGGALVSLLMAFLFFNARENPFNLIFAATAEEENSGKNGIESITGELERVALAVIGEPTKMNLAVAEKGLMVLDGIARGKSGHAARDEGDNAIYKALQDIGWFQKYEFPNQSPLLGKVKMNVTQIKAGSQHNVIPDACAYTVDVRVNEKYTNREVFEIIQQHVKSEISARSFRLNSSAIDPEHPVVKRAQELGISLSGSPTTSDQAVIPWTSIKIGPGDSARSHTADEFVYLKEVEKGINGYIALLQNLVL